jgi:GH15 family glucan-1,4-alpha-glucosidase
VAEVSDFMPVGSDADAHRLIRRVKTVRGNINYRMHLAPRFDYARTSHRVERESGGALFIPRGGGSPPVRLRSDVPVDLEGGDARCEFSLAEEETATFILEMAGPGREAGALDPAAVVRSFKGTLNFWRDWIAVSGYHGRWRETINRSALILKLLTATRHGSMVAAPTFSLPEVIGGSRNWDYRFTWIRDASFAIDALLDLGFTGEARRFMRWIEARCGALNPDGSLQVMYRIDGRPDLPEEELPELSGYRGSRPVRIGNCAARQLQLDIYGELLGAVQLYEDHRLSISHDFWINLSSVLDWLCDNWRQPDEGIWEMRGGRHEFLYSRLMCWVAFDRAVRLAQKRSFPLYGKRWIEERDLIYQDIFANFWSPARNAFVQYRGSEFLDAAALMMPLVGFIAADDPRWLSTLKAIEDELVYDSLVHRYITDDYIPGKEGTFCICTFWYVECLALAGDLEKARFFFEKMLGYSNHLGLYSEELGPRGELLGNFPQALTHLSLINAAMVLDAKLTEARRGCRGEGSER